MTLALPELPADWLPVVSVICPVRNEAGAIAATLAALTAQTYPSDRLELLFVDGRSDDGTTELLADLAARATVPIRVIDNPRRVTPIALNLGIAAASGEVVVLVGGHTEVAPDFVASAVQVLHETGAACVGGPIETVGEGLVARAIAIAQSSRIGVGGVAFRTVDDGAMAVDTVAFGAYRREVFDAIGDFDEELVRNQDDELNFRITQAGGTIWFDSRIRSRYRSRATLRSLRRQYYEYGLYKVRVIQKRSAVPSPRHLVPASAVAAMASAVALGAAERRLRIPAVVLGGYGAACVAGGALESRRDRGALPVVPIAIASLHLPYGVGFLVGLWRFRHLWRASPSSRA